MTPGYSAVHSDPDHHRSVFTLAGAPGELAQAVLNGARAAVQRIDLRRHEGIHPRVGAIDVAPIVYREDADRGAACAEALVLADRLGAELGLPVFLYGELGARTHPGAAAPRRPSRAGPARSRPVSSPPTSARARLDPRNGRSAGGRPTAAGRLQRRARAAGHAHAGPRDRRR